MAELTEEQKIIIGVCVGVSVIVLILIVVFICFIFYGKDKKKKRRKGYKEDIFVDRIEPNPYSFYEKRPPSLIYDPPPPPPPPPPAPVMTYVDQPITYVEKIPRPQTYKYDSWDTKPPPRKYYSDSRWDGVYRNDPIVVPVAEPEYRSSRIEAREPETIYLNEQRRKRREQQRRKRRDEQRRRQREYVDDQPIVQPIVQHRTRYIEEPVVRRRVIEQPVVQRRYIEEPVIHRTINDDQALLPKTNYIRRTVYAQPLRRTKSHGELRKSNAFVGDWNRRPDNLNDFNENAYRHGRDPFLWK